MEYTKPSTSLEWTQTSPGIWRRGIDEIEEFYATMAALYEASGRMFFGITGHASITIDLPSGSTQAKINAAEHEVDEAFGKAWLSLRHNHPTLAARVTHDTSRQEWTKSYSQLKSDVEQQKWLEETLVPITTGQTGAEFANSDPPAPKLPTLFVLRLPSITSKDASISIRRDIVLRSPHDIVDGIGTLLVLNNFIVHASRAYAGGRCYTVPALDGSETSNLSPSYRVAAAVPPELSTSQRDRLEEISSEKSALAASSSQNIEILSLPYTAGALLPGRHQRAALVFDRDETSRLLASCKAVNTTPTHMFHAAAAMIARDLYLQKKAAPITAERVRYISYILRNERAVCKEPYSTAKHPAALYHSVSGQSLVIDMDPRLLAGSDKNSRKDEFRSIVETVKVFYQEVRNDREHYALCPAMWAAGTPNLPTTPRPFPVPPPKKHASVSLSSIGLVDSIVASRIGAFRVRNPWVTGEELGNGLGLFLGTFDGELCLSAAYNEAWHGEAEVAEYLGRCKAVVFDCLEMAA